MIKKLFVLFLTIIIFSSSSRVANAVGEGWWSTQGNKIVDERGQEVLIRGINWGFEVYNEEDRGMLDDSKIANYKDMLRAMSDFGFNTIRFVWRDWQLEDDCVFQNKKNKNPELAGLSCLEVMDKVIEYASALNMRIILDHHTLLGSWKRSPKIIANWRKLAERYKNNPYVIGADLDNEPHHSSVCWGCGEGADWRMGAEQVGNEILKVNPKWLVIVEGVLGIDLEVVKQHPIRLSNPRKLVYSIHVYPGVTHGVPDSQIESVWDTKFGYLVKENIAPVLVGEFQTLGNMGWFVKLINYMKDNKISGTVWAWRFVDPKYAGYSWYTMTQIESDYLTVVNDSRKKPLKDWLSPLTRNPNFTPPPTETPKKNADANDDGKVDGVDYTIWLTNYGQDVTQKRRKGDFDENGKVDGVDYLLWLNNLD